MGFTWGVGLGWGLCLAPLALLSNMCSSGQVGGPWSGALGFT